MSITLNYRGIELEVMKFNTFDQRAVYDATGVDYLYTHTLIEAQCVFNPYATAANKNAVRGDSAAAAIASLRRTLLAQRGVLTVGVGGAAILVSPQFYSLAGLLLPFDCDANNGLHPIDCNIVSFMGERSFLVVFRIETWLNKCDTARALLSHRWQMEQDFDEYFDTTRTITGTAIFRTDVLRQANLTPDDFRQFLLHPIPNNFKRNRIKVAVTEDGTTLRYAVQDVEQTSKLHPNRWGIVKAEGSYKKRIDWSSAFPIGLPTAEHTVQVQRWGLRSTTRQQLANAAVHALGTSPFGDIGPGVIQPTRAGEIEMDLIHRHVRASLTMQTSGLPILGGLAAVRFAGAGLARFNPRHPDPWPEFLGAPSSTLPFIASTADGQTIRPPASGGTRGHIGQMAAQALAAPCASVAKAPSANVLVARDATPP